MDAFRCERCSQLVFFDNDTCLRCGAALGWHPGAASLVVLEPDTQRCPNHATIGCNWLPATAGQPCTSCRLTRTTPPQGDAEAVAAWAEAERAKRRLVAQLLVIGLPVDHLAFDLLSSRHDDDVVIGHADGVVTIDVEEADDARRVQVREQLAEPYRTLLGHFRHETGHGMHARLVVEQDAVDDFRAVFGDERASYEDALDRHYGEGPPEGWQDRHVSAYATMHPHEDWAETFAHYLHLRAMLGTADAFGLDVDAERLLDEPPVAVDEGPLPPGVDEAARQAMQALLARWLPLSYALNAMSRALGDGDLYPFVLAPAVVDKLAFVHARVTAAAVATTSPGHDP